MPSPPRANNSGFLSELGDQLSSSPHFINLPRFEGRKPIIGICAMDNKARSKAMSNILDRLLATTHYTVVFFGEKTILDEDIEKWPLCDFLISFFSRGFPLAKAVEYFRLRKPFSVNSLVRQHLLFDRRIVLEILHHIGVPTPFHVVVNRDGGPSIEREIDDVVFQKMGLRLGTADSISGSSEIEEEGEDYLKINGRIIRKPFVEKPCDAEDHNIYIYYSSAQGGGVRKLFRKVGNKSSEFYAGLGRVRRDASYIYEEFVDVDNAVDVKVYTVGRDYAHAETRKSPVVDGHVRRNSEGKEMRFVTQLSGREREYARLVSEAFGQRICGFDLLRAHGKSMVIDVNGWSFVKGNSEYYDSAARLLDARFQEALRNRWFARFVDADAVGRLTYESRWVLKGVFNVCRHADRTPKQKLKHTITSSAIAALLDAAQPETIFRQKPDLHRALDALAVAIAEAGADASLVRALSSLHEVLRRKIEFPGTKVQLKRQKKGKGVQFVLKWGGECTHAGLMQSQDLGENMRKDLELINRRLITDDVKIYSSTERRVLSTVNAYCTAFFRSADGGLPFSDKIDVRSDMLDDSTVAKDEMDLAKSQIRGFFNFAGPLAQNPFDSPSMALSSEFRDPTSPRAFVSEIAQLMRRLISRMERNFDDLGPEGLAKLQGYWCCNETAELFRERWKKILDDFSTSTPAGVESFDPAKVGELYDSLKYDALHNRSFLERIFMSPDKLAAEMHDAALDEYLSFSNDPSAEPLAIPIKGNGSLPAFTQTRAETDLVTSKSHSPQGASDPPPPEYPPDPLFTQQDVRLLYYKAKQLFDFVTQREYGIEQSQKRKIGIQASVPLLRQLISDLELVKQGKSAHTRFYFTKESHIHTLLNLVFLCGMPTVVDYDKVGELDYLTHIIFEVYERKPDADAGLVSEYSLRVGFSPGANCCHVLDINVDGSHALKVLPRRNFTEHMPLDKAIGCLRALLDDKCVNVG